MRISHDVICLLSLLFHIPCYETNRGYQPYNGSNFRDILREHAVKKLPFVDKTLLIEEFISRSPKFTMVTRPRRWGKSLNMNMLYQFLMIELDKNGNRISDESREMKPVFEGGNFEVNEFVYRYRNLEIGDFPVILKDFQGRWPVLKLDFSTIFQSERIRIDNATLGEKFARFISGVLNEEYSFLKSNLAKLKLEPLHLEIFQRYLGGGNISLEDCAHFIEITTNALYHFFDGQPVYVLIDEYDSVINRVLFENEQSSLNFRTIFEFFKSLYAPFKISSFQSRIKKVMATGVLPYNELDAFEVMSVVDFPLKEYYGFTKPEIDILIDLTPRLENPEDVLKNITNYYDGYSIGGQKIFNPWSVSSCLCKKGAFGNYWKETGDVLDVYANKALVNEKIRDGIELLMYKEKFVTLTMESKYLSYSMLQNPTATTSCSILLHSGLLTASLRMSEAKQILYQVSIPNREIQSIIYEEVLIYELKKLGINHTDLPGGLNNPGTYLIAGNMSEFESKTRLFFSKRCKASTIPSEKIFHLVMEALLFPLYTRYQIISEMQSGFGKPDVLLVPLSGKENELLPVSILMYKFVKVAVSDKNTTMEKLTLSCVKAIREIEGRNYISKINTNNRRVYYIGAAISSTKEFKVEYVCLQNSTKQET